MDFEALTALESKIEEPYVLLWPPGGQDGLASQAYVVMKRKGGFLIAVPPMYIPAGVLQQTVAEEDFVFGLHTKLVVPAAKPAAGEEDVQPGDLEVLVIDAKEELAGCLRHARDVDFEEEDVVTFSDDGMVPDVDLLVQYVKEWLEVQTDQRAVFYSAEEVSEQDEEMVPEIPKTAKKPPKEPKPKRNTNAALAAQLSEVAGLLPELMNQVSQLQKTQAEMQSQMSNPPLPVPPRGSQLPVSGSQMQQSDPLLDQAASSTGTSLGSKGALGREKLQTELSTRTGGFYMSVLQNALRRMRPASRLPTSLEEVPADFSMVTYLERFGGLWRKQRSRAGAIQLGPHVRCGPELRHGGHEGALGSFDGIHRTGFFGTLAQVV